MRTVEQMKQLATLVAEIRKAKIESLSKLLDLERNIWAEAKGWGEGGD